MRRGDGCHDNGNERRKKNREMHVCCVCESIYERRNQNDLVAVLLLCVSVVW